MEGVATATDIDRAMRLGFGFPMGPLELADTIGLDVLIRLMERLFRELGDLRYKPCPLLRRMVREGRLGKKCGEGFLLYGVDGEHTR
jgi:3-hydroxybutyryl-CoA dehydrogenase